MFTPSGVLDQKPTTGVSAAIRIRWERQRHDKGVAVLGLHLDVPDAQRADSRESTRAEKRVFRSRWSQKSPPRERPESQVRVEGPVSRRSGSSVAAGPSAFG